VGSDLPLKILFVVPYAPNRIRTRSFHLIQTLASVGHQITLATLWSNREEWEDVRRLAGQLDGLVAERMPLARSVWNCLRSFPTSQPVQAAYSWSPRLAARLVQTLETKHFDVIHVEHLRGARYGLLLRSVLARCPQQRTPLIWDSVDCISRLFRDAARKSHTFCSRLTTRIELPKTQRYEGWLTTRFVRVLVTSETDRRELLKLAANWSRRQRNDLEDSLGERIVVVPNGVDLDYFAPEKEPRRPLTLVISGKMSYHANVTAVVRFVKDVMPLIWAQLPDAHLWVVGKDPPPEIQDLGIPWKERQAPNVSPTAGETRIQITGTVEDIRPFLCQATLAVAPIQYGAGIQNKVLEALACGTPVVATPRAVDALRVQTGQHLMVAESQRELADSILSLLNDPQMCSRLGREGRLFVEQQHDWCSAVRNLTQIYRDATSFPETGSRQALRLDESLNSSVRSPSLPGRSQTVA
jgi:glycosyltransferase involved in cell wall biosynthesis